MKNLANCNPSEFLKQTNRIRKSVEKWLTDTDILNIRKRQPKLPEIPEGATGKELDKLNAERRKLIEKQGRKNLSAMLDAIMDEHPDETLEVLALASFVEPEDVDKYPVSEYLGSFNEILNDKNVVGFFTSLIDVVQKLG